MPVAVVAVQLDQWFKVLAAAAAAEPVGTTQAQAERLAQMR
jgi:hypothetical protein